MHVRGSVKANIESSHSPTTVGRISEKMIGTLMIVVLFSTLMMNGTAKKGLVPVPSPKPRKKLGKKPLPSPPTRRKLGKKALPSPPPVPQEKTGTANGFHQEVGWIYTDGNNEQYDNYSSRRKLPISTQKSQTLGRVN